MLQLLEAIGLTLLAIVLVFLLVCLVLLIIGSYKAVSKTLKGGQENGNNNPEP